MSKKNTSVVSRMLVIAVLILFFIEINRIIDRKRLEEIKPVNDNELYVYQVDSLDVDGSDIILNGWFFRIGEYRNEPQNYNYELNLAVLLEELDPKSGEVVCNDGVSNEKERRIYGVLSEMSVVLRHDVCDYFSSDSCNAMCGFSAKFKMKDIDFDNGLYQVAFKTDISNSDTIQANAYIYKGKLSYVNPVLSNTIDATGTDLAEIVENGVCILSRPDVNCNIYQYGWKLYWIVEDGFDFKSDGTYMQYQIETTQFDRLPNYRTDNNQYWGDLSADFEDYEISNKIDCGNYRVSVRDLPNGYSITGIHFGSLEDEKWNWYSYVRPYYAFSSIPDAKVSGYIGDDVADWVQR